MTDPIETAVDATLNVAAELARVTAELATLKAGVEQLSNPQAVRVNIYRGTIAKPWPEPHEVGGELVARAEALEKEVERLKAIIADQSRDEQGRVSMPLAAHDKIDAARRERDEATARERAAIEARALAMREEALAERARVEFPRPSCPCGAPLCSRTPGARCLECATAKRRQDAAAKRQAKAAERRVAREATEREQRRALYFERVGRAP